MKESCLSVAEVGYDASRPPAETTYELPDGTLLRTGALRETIPELHFRQDAMGNFKALLAARQVHPGWNTLQSAQVLGVRGQGGSSSSMLPYPLHHLVHQSLLTCQPSIRKDLCHNSALGSLFFCLLRACVSLVHQASLALPFFLHALRSHSHGGGLQPFWAVQAPLLGDAHAHPLCLQAPHSHCHAPGAPLLLLDWRQHPGLPGHLPAAVDQQGRVR